MKNRNIVRHSAKLTKGRSKLTATEMRAFLATLTTIEQHDTEFKEVVLTKQEFLGDTNISLDYRNVRAICRTLLKFTHEVNEFDTEKQLVWKGYTVYQRFSYDEKTGEIRFKFNDDMRPFLLNLTKNFTKYDIRCILNMTSQYSIKIYQILKNLRNLTRQKEWNLIEFQEWLKVPNSKLRWYDFKKDILETAKNEINKYTDLEILGFFPEKIYRKKVISFSIKFAPKNELKAIENFKHMGKRERELKEQELKKFVGQVFLTDNTLKVIAIIQLNLQGSDEIYVIWQYADKTQDNGIYQCFFKNIAALEIAITNAQVLLNHTEPSLFDDD